MVCTTLVYAFTLWTAVSAPVGALLPTSSTYGMQSVRVLDSLARSRQNGLLSKVRGPLSTYEPDLVCQGSGIFFLCTYLNYLAFLAS